jgi:hypothetical protein
LNVFSIAIPMRHSPAQATNILSRVRDLLAEERPDDFKLHNLWLAMAFMHASVLAKKLLAALGPTVQGGPFKGMKLSKAATDGAFAPVLLGTYEHELHPTIENVSAGGYAQIINIGSAFGYYAVGLALRMPNTVIYAFDIDKVCQEKTRELAQLNGVADRVTVDGEFKGEDFARYADKKTFALVDIEGAEVELLDPARYPALANFDFIVELHDVVRSNISRTIIERFAPTHDIQIVRNKAELYDFSRLGEKGYMDPFDELLVNWENRDGPTPWAVMKSKAR